MSLRERYDVMAADRSPVLDSAKAGSKLTIPSLFPPSDDAKNQRLPTPWQSLGARAVNNLAAKLLLTLFPPNAPFFKLTIDDFTLQKLTGQDGMRGQIEEGLNKIERAVQSEMESSGSRPALFEALKQLIVGGNALLVVSPKGTIRVFRLPRYVVKRDPMGNALLIITKECLSPLEIPDRVKPILSKPLGGNERKRTDDNIDLFTGYELGKTGWSYWQEVEGKEVPGSRGTAPKDKCPARALRWTSLDGEDYGRGMVEEFLGDFKSLEGLQKAIVQGSAAAAKVLFLVKPNSTTKKETISRSESGDVHSGNAEDVTVLQMQKYGDFKVALETRNDLIQALSFAFMLNTAIQRSGERVTAEEIRFMAQELESGLGGVYSTMSQDLQLPLVKLLMNNMQRESRLPSLPEKSVKLEIVTGMEAIGRGNDLNRLTSFAQSASQVLGPEKFAARINDGEFLKRLGTSYQLDMGGLVKSDQQVQQEQAQAQAAELASRAAPNVVNQMGAAMAPQGATPNG